jgi:hypothetical protein
MAGVCRPHWTAWKYVQKLGWKTCNLERKNKLTYKFVLLYIYIYIYIYICNIWINICLEEMYGTDVMSILNSHLTS